jgi:hypothetical protein
MQVLSTEAYNEEVQMGDVLTVSKDAITYRVESHEERRFKAACAAMQGILANPGNDRIEIHGYAIDAVRLGDALLERLK